MGKFNLFGRKKKAGSDTDLSVGGQTNSSKQGKSSHSAPEHSSDDDSRNSFEIASISAGSSSVKTSPSGSVGTTPNNGSPVEPSPLAVANDKPIPAWKQKLMEAKAADDRIKANNAEIAEIEKRMESNFKRGEAALKELYRRDAAEFNAVANRR